MINKERMRAAADAVGIALTGELLEKLDDYAALLVEWNQRMNLTAITEPQAIEEKHFLDCLQLAVRLPGQGSCVDVGSGAGFPGMVIKLYRPSLQVTLMEPTGKRLAFLEAVATQLGAPVQLVKERAEEAARKGWRQSFDIATARAVAALPALCEYCLPLVKPGGVFVAMKADAAAEMAQAQQAVQLLGGRYRESAGYTLPDSGQRCLIFIDKAEPTPDKYPRAGGVIAKRPL